MKYLSRERYAGDAVLSHLPEFLLPELAPD
jgi:hypothetical protein